MLHRQRNSGMSIGWCMCKVYDYFYFNTIKVLLFAHEMIKRDVAVWQLFFNWTLRDAGFFYLVAPSFLGTKAKREHMKYFSRNCKGQVRKQHTQLLSTCHWKECTRWPHFLKIFIYLLWAMLSLSCCTGFSLVVTKWKLLSRCGTWVSYCRFLSLRSMGSRAHGLP